MSELEFDDDRPCPRCGQPPYNPWDDEASEPVTGLAVADPPTDDDTGRP